MIKLLSVFSVCMVLAALSDASSKKDIITDNYIKRERFFFFFIFLVMAVFAGLRTRFNDTGVYLMSYMQTPTTKPDLSQIDWSPGTNPGYNLFMWIMRYLGVSAQSYLMIYSVLITAIYVWFIRKYTADTTMTIFLIFTMGIYTLVLSAIKQSIAIAFCLIAVDRCIRKKWFPFVLWILVAMMFHAYSFMFLICPFLMFRPWTTKTYQLLLIFGIIGISLQPLLGTVIDITTMLGDDYSIENFSGEGVNPFRFAVCAIPLLLSFVSRKIIAGHDESDSNNLLMNLSMLNAEIMFVALFGTAIYFGRLANYFLIFQAFSLPLLLKMFSKKSRTFLTLFAISGYLAYFYYEHAITNSFDTIYTSVPLIDYLKTLLN